MGSNFAALSNAAPGFGNLVGGGIDFAEELSARALNFRGGLLRGGSFRWPCSARQPRRHSFSSRPASLAEFQPEHRSGRLEHYCFLHQGFGFFEVLGLIVVTGFSQIGIQVLDLRSSPSWPQRSSCGSLRLLALLRSQLIQVVRPSQIKILSDVAPAANLTSGIGRRLYLRR